jgi:hypothetical protein
VIPSFDDSIFVIAAPAPFANVDRPDILQSDPVEADAGCVVTGPQGAVRADDDVVPTADVVVVNDEVTHLDVLKDVVIRNLLEVKEARGAVRGRKLDRYAVASDKEFVSDACRQPRAS